MNRLSKLLAEFLESPPTSINPQRESWSFKPDDEGITIRIQTPSNRTIAARYTFPSQDSYVFGASAGSISSDPQIQSKIANDILHSNPVTGITERIIDNNIVLLGGRQNLQSLPDNKIFESFEEDVKRITTSFNRVHKVLKQPPPHWIDAPLE